MPPTLQRRRTRWIKAGTFGRIRLRRIPRMWFYARRQHGGLAGELARPALLSGIGSALQTLAALDHLSVFDRHTLAIDF